jgi:hypothetical protein
MFRCSVPEVCPGEVLEVAETGTSYRILRLIGESSSWRNYRRRRPMQSWNYPPYAAGTVTNDAKTTLHHLQWSLRSYMVIINRVPYSILFHPVL